jgi:hypothetical protein
MVSVYSSLTVDDMKVFGGAFEKRYGIKLQLWRSSSEDILQRAVVEARGGRFDVDAIETSAAEMESLHREKLLQEVKSPHIVDLSPAALLPHREWIGDRLNLITAAYNTDLIKPAALPKTYDDLIDPRWKGKLGIEADDSIWFGALITALGEEKGLKLFRDMVRADRMVCGPARDRALPGHRRDAPRAASPCRDPVPGLHAVGRAATPARARLHAHQYEGEAAGDSLQGDRPRPDAGRRRQVVEALRPDRRQAGPVGRPPRPLAH